MICRSLAVGLLILLSPATGYADPKSLPTTTPPKAFHVVQAGETLGVLAKRYGVSVTALVEANGLAKPDFIRVGQKLVIPDAQEKADPRQARMLRPPARFGLGKPEVNGRIPEFGWPVEGPVSSLFGRRRAGWHSGIDIKAEVGTPIFAAAPGTVYYSGWETRYGRVIKIQHTDGFATVYAHNFQIFVDVGDEVYGGQVIGTVGRTGRASAYHLHFEIRNNGKVYDPLLFLPTRDIRAEPDAAAQPEDTDEE